MKFMQEFHRLRNAACVIQAKWKTGTTRENFMQELLRKIRTVTLLQRVYRGYYTRKQYGVEVSKIRKAWKWFKPQHLQQSSYDHILPRNTYGVNIVTLPAKPSWLMGRDLQLRDLQMASELPLPKRGLNPLEEFINTHLDDGLGDAKKKKKKRRGRGRRGKKDEKKGKIAGGVGVGASPIKGVTQGVLRAMMRAAPVTDMGTVGGGSNVVDGLTVDKALGIGPESRKIQKKIERQQRREERERREQEQLDAEEQERLERGSDFYSSEDETKEYSHPWSETEEEDSDDSAVTIEPLVRANATKDEMKWRKFRSGLRQARVHETFIEKMLSVMQRGEKSLSFEEFHNTFKVTRPIPVVREGKFEMTADAGELYLDILYELSSAHPNDPTVMLADDDEAIVQVSFGGFPEGYFFGWENLSRGWW